ncbi:tetratricopeptide repeat protein [Fulvivirga ulvae]|uniref:tetratricopeptide repeat protein n=1 Tax=Fulvivirga ulvae TaxID=2904245 RepID=UPI001F31B309|nr:tetratricopeptide repeat protein [Fulvivirga ulvae]UII33915.1 tetratricopeptide repeat protein [Fulvivirga ulvae]
MLRCLILALLISPALKAQVPENIPIITLKKTLDTTSSNHEHLYYQIAQTYQQDRSYDSAISYYQKCMKGYMGKNYEIGMAFTHNNLGTVYNKLGKIDSSIFHYKAAIQYYQNQNDTTSVASALTNLGMVNKQMGSYSLALENLLIAARLLDPLGNTQSLGACYNTIGSIYASQEDYDNAIAYHRKALSIRKSLNNQKEVASSLNNIGIIYRNLEEYDSALTYLNQSLKIKENLNDKSLVASTLNNIGGVLINLDQIAEAKDYLERSLNLRSIHDKSGKAITYNNLANIYNLQNQPQKALLYLDSAQALIKEGGFLSEMEDNLNFRMLAYEQLGRYDKSLECARELMVVRDSLLNSDKVQRLIEMQTKYETEKKEQSIAMLETERELQKAEIDLSRLWIIILGISVVLVFVIGLSIYTKFRSESRNKKQIQLLMQELHHRVKNNLQLLSNIFSLQSRTITDAGALEAVRSGENRINAMAIIHQKLYKKTESRSVNIHDYLGDLISQLADSYGYDQLQNDSIEVDIQPVELDVDKVIPIGLIVNELVSNSFKYAFPVTENPELKVILHLEKDQLHLRIEDNGPGFSKPDKFESSMGLNIIETLSRQLNATIKWETSNKTKLNLLMPLK